MFLFDALTVIQINNVRVFFKFELLLLVLFNLQMLNTHVQIQLFPILFYLEQLSCVVFGKQECSDMYIYLKSKAS